MPASRIPRFRNWPNWPIQRKLLLIILGTIAVSLLLIMAGIVAYEVATYRSRLMKEITSLGGFLAANSAPTLAFDDPKTAQDILNTLRASLEISDATLYTTEGRVFASYIRSGQPPFSPPARPGTEGLHFTGSHVEFVRSVTQKGMLMGTLYLRGDMAGVYPRLRGYLNIVIVVALALGGGALLLQVLLRRLISEPLLRLSNMARRIAGGDLTVRVPEESGDEIGQLAGALNHMNAELAHSYSELQHNISRLQAANKELEAFSYSVSHDLRAPLRHIKGFVEMLNKRSGECLDEKSRHYLDVISDSAGKMGNLIDDLLAFSRAGRAQMARESVDFNMLAREVINDLSFEKEGRKVEWKIQDLPTIFGDPTLLRQVWVNLISNALKFTRLAEHAIIEISSRDDEGTYVFSVKDNGVGFDMRYKDKLFGLFQRLHRPEEFEGTGVGLANVQRIVDRHGGSVWAESEPGKGTIFYFSLPKRTRKEKDGTRKNSSG